jgi:DNA-directed RNA polymerase II subunit RPB1
MATLLRAQRLGGRGGTAGAGRGRGRGRTTAVLPLAVTGGEEQQQPLRAAAALKMQIEVEDVRRDKEGITLKEGRIKDTIKQFIMSPADDFRKTGPKFVVEGMTLNFISTEEMKALSVMTCTQNCHGYDYSIDAPAMGTTSRFIPCGTCSLVDVECPGHFGLIQLAVPIFHPLAIDYIVYILQSLCLTCKSLTLPSVAIPRHILKLPTYTRLREIAAVSKNKNCHKCQGKNKYTFSTSKERENNVIVAVSNSKHTAGGGGGKGWSTAPPLVLSPQKIIDIFTQIPEHDIKTLGFQGNRRHHPKNFIMEVLPVIPERNRPPTFSEGEFKPDHLTIVYNNIINENKAIKDFMDKKESEPDPVEKGKIDNEVSLRVQKLWTTISHFINNNDNELKIRKTEIAKTLNKRITGKEGYPRFFAQGKRADFTARSVIGPGIIPFGYIIVPNEIRVLTVPEKVHAANLSRIRELAKVGEIERLMKPGKAAVFYKIIYERSLAVGSKPIEIEIGDVITRYASTGDDVFLNRQPTLHRHSMTGCRTVFHTNKKTLQIHMSYTTPQNADFDGDESNINMPQSLFARSEIRHIMAAHHQIMSVGNCKPAMGLVFNCPTAAYLLSKDANESDARVARGENPIIVFTPEDEAEVVGLFIGDGDRMASLPGRLAKNKVVRGTARALLSMIFPEDFNYYRKSDNKNEDPVIVKDGIFISGLLTKGDVAGKMIQSLHLQYGDEVTGQFISEGQFILDWYIERRGFTIGLKDMILANYAAGKAMIAAKIVEIRHRVFSIDSAPFETAADKLFRNRETRSILDSIKNIGKELADPEIAGQGNSLGDMVKSGAKGNFDNISSIMGIVGQQFINGRRPERTIFGNRGLCYFDPGDHSLESNGFVVNSFVDGMTPSEFFFHSEGVRLGLLDTALKTGEIGAITHKISKVMENEMVGYNGAIVNSKGVYTSMAYGEGYSRGELTKVTAFSSTGSIYMPFDLSVIAKQLNEEE